MRRVLTRLNGSGVLQMESRHVDIGAGLHEIKTADREPRESQSAYPSRQDSKSDYPKTGERRADQLAPEVELCCLYPDSLGSLKAFLYRVAPITETGGNDFRSLRSGCPLHSGRAIGYVQVLRQSSRRLVPRLNKRVVQDVAVRESLGVMRPGGGWWQRQ